MGEMYMILDKVAAHIWAAKKKEWIEEAKIKQQSVVKPQYLAPEQRTKNGNKNALEKIG